MQFYIVRQPEGHCKVVSSEQLLPDRGTRLFELSGSEEALVKQWGPFVSRDEAIARRIGLIRAGKCQPQ
ncbi:MAG: DDE transposase family protein [Microcoleaceae cyanobacterium]